MNKVERVHTRDRKRYLTALGKETTLRPHHVTETMWIACADCDLGGIGQNDSLRQLCNYLADAILFYPPAHRARPLKPGNNIPPFSVARNIVSRDTARSMDVGECAAENMFGVRLN